MSTGTIRSLSYLGCQSGIGGFVKNTVLVRGLPVPGT